MIYEMPIPQTQKNIFPRKRYFEQQPENGSDLASHLKSCMKPRIAKNIERIAVGAMLFVATRQATAAAFATAAGLFAHWI